MRLLLVAFSDSIHTARWVAQIADQGWDVRLFPSIDCGLVHSSLKDITVYHSLSANSRGLDFKRRFQQYRLLGMARSFTGVRLLPLCYPNRRLNQLHRVISDFRPDIIHTIEMQAAGYLVLKIKNLHKDNFPPWIVTNYGSDIHYFGRFPEHASIIREVLANCDYYTCECERDIRLAAEFGYTGRKFPVFPNAGGFDIQAVAGYRSQGPVSARRIIMLKGYQHWAGRALVGIKALSLCHDILKGYTIVVHSATPDVVRAAKRFQSESNISVKVLAKDTPHDEILRTYGQSRVAIGLSLSDGISTSFLEAFLMGSFPIQSCTACADEWIEDGKTGILVLPEDHEKVAAAIRRALTDDALVNEAAINNYRVAARKLDHNLLKSKAIDLYTTVANRKGISHGI